MTQESTIILFQPEWTVEQAVQHLGEARASRYLRKFYPWYVGQLELAPAVAKPLLAELQKAETLAQARRLLAAAAPVAVAA